MIYSKLKTKHGTVVIKDGSEQDFMDLVGVYRDAFKKHNIFQKSHDEIIQYLKKKRIEVKKKSGSFIAARIGKKCVGAAFVMLEEIDSGATHSRWKLRHAAVMAGYQRMGIGRKLMEAADTRIYDCIKSKHLKTAKVEVSISEGEKESIGFYKKMGFDVEGELSHHYRHKESSHVLGKLIE